MASCSGIKGLEDIKPDPETRVHICTIQGLVKRVLYNNDPADVPPIGQYDQMVIDECHRGYAAKYGMQEPSPWQRCWTLNYADEAQFHMDVLPSVPDAQRQRVLREARSLPLDFVEKSVSITDTEHANFRHLSEEWPASNPNGYADWFHSRMKPAFESRRRAMMLAEAKADVPAGSGRRQQALDLVRRQVVPATQMRIDRLSAVTLDKMPAGTLSGHGIFPCDCWCWTRPLFTKRTFCKEFAVGRVACGPEPPVA